MKIGLAFTIIGLKLWDRFVKSEGKWTYTKEIRTREKFLAVGKACHGYTLTYSIRF